MNDAGYDTVNEDEYSEWLPNLDSKISIDDQDDEPQVTKKRGRQAIPLCWTRVISICHDNLVLQRVFPIATDKLVADGLPIVPRKRI